MAVGIFSSGVISWVKRRKLVFFGFILSAVIVLHFLNIIRTVQPDIVLRPCKINALNPWDDTLKPFIHAPPTLSCTEKYDLLYVDNTGNVCVNQSASGRHSIDFGKLNCVYQRIRRLDGDETIQFEQEEVLEFPAQIKCHVFRVKCTDKDGDVVYDMAHFNWFWNEHLKPDHELEIESEDKLSVILFGIDSVSRSHAIRNLPKSLKFLNEEFKVYDFIGYRKVGENTWPNVAPMYTGRSHKDTYWTERLLYSDSLPLLWSEPATKSIATFFAEDRPDISTFGLGTSGFYKAPTDYFFRPYTLALYETEPVIGSPLGKAHWYCYGKRNFFDLQIDYLKGFLRKYRHKRKLAISWSNEVAHEDFSTLARGDDPLLDFLKWLKESKNIENTVLLTLSDHGFRIGGASLTHIGRAENNSPWLMMHVPKRVLEKYPWVHKSLEENTQRLVTAYDIHETIHNILNNKALVKRYGPPISSSLVPRSLFTPIPHDRTCAEAGIDGKYCTCIDKVNVSASTPLAQSLALKLVESLNEILRNYSNQCAKLTLHNVTEVSVIYSNSDQLNIPEKQRQKKSWLSKLFDTDTVQDLSGRYTVLFFTVPGYALFESTLDYAQFESESKQMTAVGEPSRLNKYGSQSHCMNTSLMKQFCFCKKQL